MKKVLWIPIFSMRSYETGKYSLLKDGNFQLTMARVLASDFDEITIVLPMQSNEFQELVKRYHDLMDGRNIKFTFMEYGENAVDTRKRFWELNRTKFFSDWILDIDLIITDITGYPGTMSYDIPFINNFNITKLPELDRPYIDQFFEEDLRSIEASMFTTVINPRQREYILEVAPHLKDKVIAYTKVAHSDLMPSDHKTSIFQSPRYIFWPFRISDKAYKWEQFLEMFVENKLDKRWKIVITDPNDSYKGDYAFVTKTKMTKDRYYETLGMKPVVVMLDEIDTVLHPGTIEFFHYNCPVITLKNELVGNPYQVETIDQIPEMLSNVGYNNRVNTRDFVYSHKEISEKYNKEFVSKCLENF